MYHHVTSLHPPDGRDACFAQLYIFNTADEQHDRRAHAYRDLDLHVLCTIQDVLHETHRFVQVCSYLPLQYLANTSTTFHRLYVQMLSASAPTGR